MNIARNLVAMLVLALVGTGGCSSRSEIAGTSELTATSAAAYSTPASRAFAPVAAMAWPNAACKLYPPNNPSDTLDIYADDLGIARFAAVHAQAGDPITWLSLDCADGRGGRQAYVIDLTSSETFQPSASAPPSEWPAGSLRPALDGDPMQYSQSQLLALGYGMRPDPVQAPAAYAHWLQMVSKPTRRVLNRGHSSTRSPRVANCTSSGFQDCHWGGGMLSAQTCCFHSACEFCQDFAQSLAEFYVPSTSYQANSAASIWGGLGGWYESSQSLLQDGVLIYPNGSGTAMAYEAWVEFYQGSGVVGEGYSWAHNVFSVNANDLMWAEAWACDSQGNQNWQGGHGCFYIEDQTLDIYVDCHTPTDSCPSLTAYNTFEGWSAEGIAEYVQNAYPNLSDYGSVTVWLTAQDSGGSSWYFSNDSSRSNAITQINGSGQTMQSATLDLGGSDTTITWHQAN